MQKQTFKTAQILPFASKSDSTNYWWLYVVVFSCTQAGESEYATTPKRTIE